MPERFPKPYVDHRVLTLHGVEPHRLNDLPFFVRTFNEMLQNDLKVDVIGEFRVHQFRPSGQGEGDGISGVGIIGASHEAIHSWPELWHLRANFEFCSKQEELRLLDQHMLERFNPAAMESEQSLTYPDGRDLLHFSAYSQTLERTASGLIVYRGAKSSSSGIPETAQLLTRLENPGPEPYKLLARKHHGISTFTLPVKVAA